MIRKSKKKYPGVREVISKKHKLPNGLPDSIFYFRYKINGKDKEVRLGRKSEGWTAQKAWMEGQKLKAQALAKPQARPEMTLTQFWDNHYYNEIKCTNKPSTFRDKVCKWEKIIKPTFGHLSLQAITRAIVEQHIRNRLAAGKAPATVNRDLSLLKHMLNVATSFGLLETNPLIAIKPLRERNQDKWKFLTQKDMEKIKKALSPHYHDLFLFLVYMGMRMGATLAIRWQDVDIEKGIIFKRAYSAKSGTNESIPMHPKIKTLLQNRYERFSPKPDDRIFVHSHSNFAKALKTALKKAGLPHIRVHDLRHTFASWLVQNGVPLKTVQELLDHKDIKTTMRYAHLSPEHLRDAINQLP